MKFSVIIPTYNRRKILLRTLPTVLSQDFPPDEYEVVIVVDGSSDGTIEALHTMKTSGCDLRVLQQPNKGQAPARNLGLQHARGDLVLNLDDDTFCDPALLRKHLDAHSTNNNLVVSGTVLVHPDSPSTLATDLWRRMADVRAQRLERGENRPPWNLWMANCSISRRLLLDVGGFDESMRYCHEDQELGIRLWRAGFSFLFEPGAIVHHLYVKSNREWIRKDGPWDGKSGVVLARKYPEFRPFSAAASVGSGTWPRRLLRRVATSLPVSIEPVLRPLTTLLNSVHSKPAVRNAGCRLLHSLYEIEAIRGAIDVTGSWKALHAEFGKTLPVLLYHHVGPPRSGTYPELTVSPERFEQQVRWLYRRGYRGITTSDWLKWRREGKGLPNKPVLVTFDDAYADIATYALPILRRYGFGGLVFVVTRLVGATNEWDEAQGSGTHRLMTAEQIRDWAEHEIEFGAHGRTHADLTTMPQLTIVDEVSGSAQDLAAIVGKRVNAFSYPFGRHNKCVRDSVQEFYDLAFVAGGGPNTLRTDSFALNRISVLDAHSAIGLEYLLHWKTNLIKRIRAELRIGTA